MQLGGDYSTDQGGNNTTMENGSSSSSSSKTGDNHEIGRPRTKKISSNYQMSVLFTSIPIKKVPELERLQNWHCNQESRIRELKHEIESVKLRLEKRKQELPKEKMEAIRTLNDEYNRLRAEYHSLSIQSGNRE